MTDQFWQEGPDAVVYYSQDREPIARVVKHPGLNVTYSVEDLTKETPMENENPTYMLNVYFGNLPMETVFEIMEAVEKHTPVDPYFTMSREMGPEVL